MNKTDMVDAIAERSNVTKGTIRKVLDVLPDVFAEALMDRDDVKISGFGTFRTVIRAPRKARNLKTGGEIVLPETAVVKFVPSTILKNAIAESTH